MILLLVTSALPATVSAVGAPAIAWEKSFGRSGWDKAYAIQQTRDSGYIVAGEPDSHDGAITGAHSNWDCFNFLIKYFFS